jgi:hypothetical protein
MEKDHGERSVVEGGENPFAEESGVDVGGGALQVSDCKLLLVADEVGVEAGFEFG